MNGILYTLDVLVVYSTDRNGKVVGNILFLYCFIEEDIHSMFQSSQLSLSVYAWFRYMHVTHSLNFICTYVCIHKAHVRLLFEFLFD